jgi:hypothetical protein
VLGRYVGHRVERVDRARGHRPRAGHDAERPPARPRVRGDRLAQGAGVEAQVGVGGHGAQRDAEEVGGLGDREVDLVAGVGDEAPAVGLAAAAGPQRDEQRGEVGHRAAAGQ